MLTFEEIKQAPDGSVFRMELSSTRVTVIGGKVYLIPIEDLSQSHDICDFILADDRVCAAKFRPISQSARMFVTEGPLRFVEEGVEVVIHDTFIQIANGQYFDLHKFKRIANKIIEYANLGE